MRELISQLIETCRAKGRVAYTSLVETRGSTPQKAGAAMLVFADGSQAGTLGGGCVEAEVKRNALRLLDQQTPEVLTFQLDEDYGWDDGLICGGRMSMLVAPISAPDVLQYYEHFHRLLSDNMACTEAIIIGSDDAEGSSPGDRYLLNAEGEIIASCRRGTIPAALTANLRPVSRRPRPYVSEGISYLPHVPRSRLVIVGGGHVGQKVAELAAETDFDVWVLDDREQYCNAERFPQAQRLILGDIESAVRELDVDASTFCIVVTRGHRHDEQALYHLAEKPAAYIGMIGSKRKTRLIFDDLLRTGISREALARVHAPLGFDIGSQTVPEIAVSIVAELIACRNLGAIPSGYSRPVLQ